MEYILHILIFISLYTILSQSLTLTAGYSKLLSLAHAGFYGIGAYTSAILSINYGWGFLPSLLLALLITGVIALVISAISIRTIDDYFIVCTLGIQIIFFSIFNNWQGFTNGPLGIPNIPDISIFGWLIDSKWEFLIVSSFFTLLIWWLLNNITQSSFGKVLLALSEDEIFTTSLGKNVSKAKITSFTLGAIFSSIAGVLYAHYISYVDPTSFTIDESIFILSIVIIGGMKKMKYIFLATLFLFVLPEILRFVNFPNSVASNLKQITYGIALIVVIFLGSKR
jgi:branched-chain amino acid transport system permease protein